MLRNSGEVTVTVSRSIDPPSDTDTTTALPCAE
jgi:hypothetical protein